MLIIFTILPALALGITINGQPENIAKPFLHKDVNDGRVNNDAMNLMEDSLIRQPEERGKRGKPIILDPCAKHTINVLQETNPPKHKYRFKVSDPTSTLSINCDIIDINTCRRGRRAKLRIRDGKLGVESISSGTLDFTSQTGVLNVFLPFGRHMKINEINCIIEAHHPSCSDSSTGIHTCGVPNIPSRIIDAEDTSVGEYPWHVGIVDTKNDFSVYCGGSIINSCYILTIIRCTWGKELSDIKVLINAHESAYGPNQTYVGVESIIKLKMDVLVHPEAVPTLLKLAEPLTGNVMPVCTNLPFDVEDFPGTELTIVGWGPKQLEGLLNPVLTARKVTYDDPDGVCEDTICTESHICQEDNGGAVLYENDDGTYCIAALMFTFIGCGPQPPHKAYDSNTNIWDYMTQLNEEASKCDSGKLIKL